MSAQRFPIHHIYLYTLLVAALVGVFIEVRSELQDAEAWRVQQLAEHVPWRYEEPLPVIDHPELSRTTIGSGTILMGSGITTGTHNVAIGYNALSYSSTTCVGQNTCIGSTQRSGEE